MKHFPDFKWPPVNCGVVIGNVFACDTIQVFPIVGVPKVAVSDRVSASITTPHASSTSSMAIHGRDGFLGPSDEPNMRGCAPHSGHYGTLTGFRGTTTSN